MYLLACLAYGSLKGARGICSISSGDAVCRRAFSAQRLGGPPRRLYSNHAEGAVLCGFWPNSLFWCPCYAIPRPAQRRVTAGAAAAMRQMAAATTMKDSSRVPVDSALSLQVRAGRAKLPHRQGAEGCT